MNKKACIRVVDDEVWFDPAYIPPVQGNNYKISAIFSDFGASAEKVLNGHPVPGNKEFHDAEAKKFSGAFFATGGKRFEFSGIREKVDVDFDKLPQHVQDVWHKHNPWRLPGELIEVQNLMNFHNIPQDFEFVTFKKQEPVYSHKNQKWVDQVLDNTISLE